MSLPIIFIHKGYSSYLEFSLRQAKLTNPASEIFLLGDDANNRFPFVSHTLIKDYFSSAAEFAKLYKHLSTNPYNFELFCFQRWFVLKDFMIDKNIQRVLVCDSDLLLYSDFNSKIKPLLDKKIELGLCQYKFVASAHLSYWTINPIKGFCTFVCSSYIRQDLFSKYVNFWEKLQKQNTPGGVCDMTALLFFSQTFPKDKTVNFLDIIGQATCDDNINEPRGIYPNEYLFKRTKKFQWIEDIPYCYNIRLKKLIKFNAIHFQGPAKYKMPLYYHGKKFTGIIKLKIIFFILSLCGYVYSSYYGRVTIKAIKRLLHYR